MRLAMVGLTHRGAPLPLLEKVSVPRGERPALLARLSEAGCVEAAVVSTCSRTEVYSTAGGGGPEGLLATLADQVGAAPDELRAAAELRTGRAVVDHLFRVTAGLDSRMVGEVEIHGQVRAAFRDAQVAGTSGPVLGQLFPAALRCGMRVRAETTLGDLGRSLGQRAVDLGLARLSGGGDPVIMLVGSGRMASAAAQHLTRQGRWPRVAARDEARAARLTAPGLVCPLPELACGMEQADLLICATSAAHHVVTVGHVRRAMAARSRPLTVVDLSVPRNVDPAVATVPGVRVIDLDSMTDDTGADPALEAALVAGEAIVTAAARRYAEDVAARAAGPVIAALRQRVDETCRRELARVVPEMDPDDLARAAHAITGKLLHRPTIAARAAAAAGDHDSLVALCETFGVRPAEIGLASLDALPAQTAS